MIKTKGRLQTACELTFCFIASVIIAVAALNIGLKTEPGKILPAGISMRSGEMSENIIRGIDLALDDVELIRSGKVTSEFLSLLPLEHFDPFFFLSLIFPESSAKTLLFLGYYFRFGLCCASMYYFLAKRLRLNRLFAALLSVMYTFSSQIIFTAQFASLMNMAIMIPAVMSAFDSYLQKRSWKGFVLVCLASFGLAVSGGFGIITGIPAMILISLFMCICLYSSFKMFITSWLKLLGGLAAGIALSMVIILPGLLSMKFDVNISESFKNSRVTYTLFELLRGTFLLRSGSIYQNTAPLFYVGILTLVALTVFALNEKIPLRIKTAAAVIMSVIHISCCSSFVNEIESVYGAAPLLSSSKLICLEIFVFFAAGIGLKNVRWLTRGEHIASCLIPLFFLIISGNSTSGTSFASPIVISTFLVIIGEAMLVYAFALNRLSGKAKYAVLCSVFVLVGINTAFIMFNNSMQKKVSEYYFKADLTGSEDLIIDKDLELPLLNDTDGYLIVPSDLSYYKAGDSLIDDLNYVSMNDSGEKLLEEIYLRTSDKREMIQDGTNTYLLNGGLNTVTFSPFVISADERLFLYCNSSNGAMVDMVSSETKSGTAFTGPFFTEILCGPGEVNLSINIESEGEDACRISFYKLNESALEAVLSLSGKVSGSRFPLDAGDTSGICTLILPYSYDDTKISINGEDRDTFEFGGKLAVTFERNSDEAIYVSVGHRSSGIIPGAVVSALTLLCLVAIPLIHMYNKNNKVNSEGNKVNA